VLQSRGQVISTASIGFYSAQSIQQLVTSNSLPFPANLKFQYDVTAYKIEYYTPDPNGNLVIASGCLCVPAEQNNLSLLSFQHGTVTGRTQVASQNPLGDAAVVSVLAASLGYYSLQPDYLGFGSSTMLHPYHNAKTSANTVIDFIRACRAFANTKNITLNSKVFLSGYSEGGFVTLAAQKEIEQNYSQEIKITASAPMAGAYDLLLTAQTLFRETTYGSPTNIAFILYSYNNIYAWNKMSDIFNSPYSQNIPNLFNGQLTSDQIDAVLPSTVNILLKQTFIDSVLQNKIPEVTNAFVNNSLIDWTPIAPIQLYQGDADELVPYQNSVEARDLFVSRGCNVNLVTINGGTHESSAIPSIIDSFTWFQTFNVKKVLAFNY
jgi:predicted esterase